jgi:chorismate lyase/3-hydroxybenzoate synthase
MLRAKAALRLSYLTRAQFEAYQIQFKGRVLGAVAFGALRPCVSAPDCPYVWIDIPVVKGDAAFEVWTSAQTVVRDDTDEIVSARNEDILFGCVLTEPGDSLDAASRLVYCRIFDFIDARGYGHLLRVWHYFPQINAVADGVEQYVKFNAGRHEAFAAKGRVLGTDTPAACALGSRSGPLVVYFLAAKRAGRLVENPRQTSAYDYPAQYGPRSPVFSRAVLMQAAGKPLLFISGTASIVGHETLHVGNAKEQARETVANILAVIEEAQRVGVDPDACKANLLLKVYLRHPDYLPMIQHQLTQAFGPEANVLYLQADICRSDLLLEVEAVCA